MTFPAPDANYTADMFKEVKDILLEAGQQGPVLLHCGDGRRVGRSNFELHSIYRYFKIHRKHSTPQPLYNIILGVQANFCV